VVGGVELGERIRAQIGAKVLDQMMDDLMEGLVRMARAEAARRRKANKYLRGAEGEQEGGGEDIRQPQDGGTG
jgi:hypothetical protein